MKAITNRPRIVDSRNDLAIKRIRRLHVRVERERSGFYYVEGLRFIATAIRHHIPILPLDSGYYNLLDLNKGE